MNLYVGSNTLIPLTTGDVGIKMETNYPWEGAVALQIDPVKSATFTLKMRIPQWAYTTFNSPGNLYKGSSNGFHAFSILLNGKEVPYREENGYIAINRKWSKGDKIELSLSMGVSMMSARPELKQDSGRIAIQRGPLVYCVEGADNNGKAWNIIVPENTRFTIIDHKVQDETVKALTAEVPVVTVGADGLSLKTEMKKIISMPYYTLANLVKNEMQVQLPVKIADIKINY